MIITVAWIVILGSFFCLGWFAKDLIETMFLIDESHLEDRDYD